MIRHVAKGSLDPAMAPIPDRSLPACCVAWISVGMAAAGPPCSFDATKIPGLIHPILGERDVVMFDINSAGTAVGWCAWTIVQRPGVWTEAQGTKQIPVGVPGLSEGQAVRINENGWILVNAWVPGGHRGFVLKPNGSAWEWIEMKPASPGGWSSVYGINDSNEVVGVQSMGMEGDPVHPFGGFKWSPEEGKSDVLIPGWTSTECYDINNKGDIVGNVSIDVEATIGVSGRGFVLTGSTVTLLPVPPAPYTKSQAKRITDGGLVGGNLLSQDNKVYRGILFDPGSGEMTIIEPMAGFGSWVLEDLNAHGAACGWAYTEWFDPDYAACVLPAGEASLLQLDDLVDERSVPHLPAAYGIHESFAIVAAAAGTPCCDAFLLEANAVGRLGDLDCDGKTGSSDLAAMLGVWGTPDQSADLDGSGLVDGADVGLLLASWSG